jgi:hypothetical protein
MLDRFLKVHIMPTTTTVNPWETPRQTPAMTPEQGARLFFGVVLLVCGLIMGGVLVYQLKQVLFGTNEPALIQRLTQTSLDDLAVLIKEGDQLKRIQLPPKTFAVIGYFFSLMALWIVGKLVYAALNLGTRLLMSLRTSGGAP